jgi:hypothetical protein
MNPVSYKYPRSIRGLSEIVASLLRKDRDPRETKEQKPPRRRKPELTTRGHFIDCIA